MSWEVPARIARAQHLQLLVLLLQDRRKTISKHPLSNATRTRPPTRLPSPPTPALVTILHHQITARLPEISEIQLTLPTPPGLPELIQDHRFNYVKYV